MFSEVAIKVENLSKCFAIYDNPSDRLKQFVLPRVQRAFGIVPKQFYKQFWALRNVTFEVKKGEVVGIIGRNGSGKSTLLQLICGTLNPTEGAIQVAGRIAALLELGSGFNPEFTGRENVYLNAAVLGLTKAEIDARLNDILAFADIGDFVDQPVKTFSSGMMMRLAFAVAINVDPQILVIDEALAVGDELFQRKCFSRIESIRAGGATILFVSHSGGAVVELCDRALFLDSGELIAMGGPKKMVGQYQKLLYAPQDKRAGIREEIKSQRDEAQLSATEMKSLARVRESGYLDVQEVIADSFDPSLKPTSTISYESHGAYIQDAAIYTLEGERVNNLTRGSTYRYRYNVQFERSASNVRFGMLIKTTSGVELGGAVSSASYSNSISYVLQGCAYCVEFEFCCRLNSGVFFLNAGVVGDLNGSETFLHRLIDVAMFRVISEAESLATGNVDFSCQPKVTML